MESDLDRQDDPAALERLQAELAPIATGESRVDAALDRLGALGALPVDDHVAVYEDVHRALQDALADLGDG